MAKLTLTQLREKHEFKLLLSSVIIVLGTGTIYYHLIEKWSWIDSIYFCVVASATVGFGDIAPTRPGSKIFTVFFILAGVAVIMGFINFIVRRRERIRQEKVEAKIK